MWVAKRCFICTHHENVVCVLIIMTVVSMVFVLHHFTFDVSKQLARFFTVVSMPSARIRRLLEAEQEDLLMGDDDYYSNWLMG